MKQVLVTIPGLGLSVYSSGLLIALGFVAGLLLAVRRSRREGLDPEVVLDLAPWLLVGGLIGARLLFVVNLWGESVHSLTDALRIGDGGLAFLGAALGALAAFLLVAARRPFPALATLDALAPSVALGLAFGRLGCFLNGCCFGTVCPWLGVGLRFPASSPVGLSQRARGMILAGAPATLPVYPTQLYMLAEAIFLFALLTAFYPSRRRHGEVFGLLLWVYPVTHFVLDTFRDDEGPAFRGLTLDQVGCFLILAAASTFWSYLGRKPERVGPRSRPDPGPDLA